MKNLFTLAFAFALGIPLASFGQGGCSGQLKISYPSGSSNSSLNTVSVNNGLSHSSKSTFCTTSASPTPTTLTVVPASDGTLTLESSSDGGNTFTTLRTINPSTSGTTYTFQLPTQTTQALSLRLVSTVDCPNPKNITFTLALAPALQFRAANPVLCPGNSTTLTAISDLADVTYTFSAPGEPTVTNTTGTLVVSPTATKTYSVTAATTDCGTTQQQVVIVVPDVSLSVEPVSATIPVGGSATIKAVSNIAAGTTYTFSAPGQPTVTNTSGALTVSPTTTTTYTVTANTPANCANLSQRTTITVTQPLPVTLVSFAASRRGDAALLNWATATELDNDYFAVERSADGKDFSTLAKVAGAGNSVKPLNYTFTDERPLATASYYRLRQADYSGKSTYSPVVSIAALGQTANWLVYDSAPRHYAVQGALDANSSFSLLDVMGRTVYSQAVTPEHPAVVVPTLPAGIYFFRLTTMQGRFTVRQALTATN